MPEFPFNPWIWRENQRGALIGFSYSEIRFLNKNIVKCLKINVICRQSIYFFQFFLFWSIADDTKLQFFGLSRPSLIKCTCENTKYKLVFRTVWWYFYDYISSTGNTYKAKIAHGSVSFVKALYPYILPKDKVCCANEDIVLYIMKSYGT